MMDIEVAMDGANGLYLGEFSKWEDVSSEFQVTIPESIEVIVAAYDTPPYEGYAFVFFRQGDTYYEVNGSHCSCYGLEGQWAPEEVVIEELVNRPHYVGYESESKSWQELIRSKIVDAAGVTAK